MTRKELIDRVEKYLNPKYNNDVFTYLQIENAIIKATKPVYEGESMTLEEFDKIHPELKHFSDDQATKERIEKEAEELPMGNYRKGYIEGASVWAERLKQLETQSHDQVRIIQHLEQEIAKEREMRKEMVEALAFVVEAHQTKITTVLKEVIEELIQKATLLTKDKSHE